MTTPARSYDFRIIPRELIDPPSIPMREAMDPTKLEELTESIRRKGVQSPIGVSQVGDRFTIRYGHRRHVASERAGESMLPCRVYPIDDAAEEDDKFTENYYREPVNPAEEATYLADILDRKFGGAIEEMAKHFGLTVAFIDGRLDLLRGDDDVLMALRAKKINLAVARELNKFKHAGDRRFRLADAIEAGATAGVVQSWRIQDERVRAVTEAVARGELPNVAPSTEAPLASVDTCLLCDLDDDQHDMEHVRLHRSCVTTQRRQLRAARSGQK